MILTTAGKKYHFQNRTVINIWLNIFSLTKRSSSSIESGEYYSVTARPFNQFGATEEDYDADADSDYEPIEPESSKDQSFFSDASVSTSTGSIVLR